MRLNSGAGSGAEPETSRRAALQAVDDRGVRLGRAAEPVVHRRDAEQHRRAVAQRRRGGRGLEAAEVAQLAAAAQRPEQAEHEPVHVEQRQPVREDVLAGPLPGVGEPVEVRGDRAARQHRALRPAGRAGRVDDERGVLVARVAAGQLAAAGVEVADPARRSSRAPSRHRRRARLSESTCSSSPRPSFGFTGTSGIARAARPTAATHVSSVDSAQTATRSAPSSSRASAAAASRSSP